MKVLYIFLLIVPCFGATDNWATQNRPVPPRVTLQWNGGDVGGGRHQRRGVGNHTKSIRQQIIEWKGDISKYQDKWVIEDRKCSGGNDCCTKDAPCGLGGGDCDSDADCQVGLRCGYNNCRNFAGPRGSFSLTDDCCERRRPCLGDNFCCTSDRPCLLGEGDCDSDSQCALNLVCGDHSACAGGVSGVDDFQSIADCCTFHCRDIQHIPEDERKHINCYWSEEEDERK